MQRRTRTRNTSRPQRSSVRTRLAFALLTFSTLVGTGLVVAPIAFVA